MIKKYITKIRSKFNDLIQNNTLDNYIIVLFSFVTAFIDTYKYQKVLDKSQKEKPAKRFLATINAIAFSIALSVIILLTVLSPIYVPIITSFDFSVSQETIDIINSIIPDFMMIGFWENVINIISNNPIIFIQLILFLIVLPIIWVVSFIILYYIPFYQSNEREREINEMLPLAYVYMYGITRKGTVSEMFTSLSKRKNIYGEISKESQSIHNRFNVGQDIYTAMREQSKITPSKKFSEFLQSIITISQQGIQTNEFLNRKISNVLEASKQSIKQKNEYLELLMQFVIIIQIAPAFLIIFGIIGQMFGTPTEPLLYFIPIIIILVNVAIIMLINIIFSNNTVINDNNTTPILSYKYIYKNPKTLLILSAIITIIYYIISFESFSIITENPTQTIIFYLFIPSILLFLPYTILFEYKYRKIRIANNNLPDIIYEIQQSNKQGTKLQDAIITTVKNRSDNLSKTIHQEIKASKIFQNVTIQDALQQISQKYNSRKIKQTMYVLNDAIKQTGNISEVLEIIEKDLQQRKQIKNERKSTTTMIGMIMTISGILLLGIFAVIDILLIEQFKDIIQQLENADGMNQGTADITEIPIQATQLSIQYSSFIIMSMIGLQLGLLRTLKISSGLKYMLLYQTITTIYIIILL